MQKVAVIGLGRFGMALARSLAASGVQVIAIDRDRQPVAEIADSVDVAVRLDSTDQQALISQDVDKVDVCVVSIGENFEASLLTTVILKRLELPRVVCRAQTPLHAEIFRQIGADEVIQPEEQAGLHLARLLSNPHVLDAHTIAEGYSLLELQAPERFIGKSIRNLALRQEFEVNLLIIRRPFPVKQDEESTTVAPDYRMLIPKADDVVASGDRLVLVGKDESLQRLPRE